jgi:hypothetical protein
MQTTWANLLANAADPRSGSLVSPSFPIILKELSSREVRFLDALYETCLTRAKGEPPREPESVTYEKASLSDIYARAGLSRDVHLASNYTEQLGRDEEEARTEQKYYLAHQAELDADVRDFDFVMDVIMRHQLLEHEQHALHVSGKVAGPNLYIHMRHSYRLSQLGGCFIKACRKPPA